MFGFSWCVTNGVAGGGAWPSATAVNTPKLIHRIRLAKRFLRFICAPLAARPSYRNINKPCLKSSGLLQSLPGRAEQVNFHRDAKACQRPIRKIPFCRRHSNCSFKEEERNDGSDQPAPSGGDSGRVEEGLS